MKCMVKKSSSQKFVLLTHLSAVLGLLVCMRGNSHHLYKGEYMLLPAVFQLASAQNNLYAKVAFLGGGIFLSPLVPINFLLFERTAKSFRK